MKTSASVASLLAHAAVLVGLGLPGRPPDPEPPGALELRTISLVEVPEPAPEPKDAPLPEPAPEPEDTPLPEPEPAPGPKPAPVPKPAPSAPSPAPSAPSPAPDLPPISAPPGPSPIPATPPAVPSPPAEPRKLGQRYSNTHRSGGRAQAKTGCAESPTKPVPTHKVAPKFPADVLRSSIAGTLTLRATVDATGAVTGVRVVESPDASAEAAAEDAFAQWRFEPATACGKAVASSYAKSWKFKGAR